MEKTVKLSFPERVKYSTNVMVKQDSFYHILFWVSLFIILTLLDNQGGVLYRIIKEVINVSFFACIAYINLWLLFPLYLKKKNLIFHVILVIFTAALLTPIKTAILFFISPNSLALQSYLMSNMMSIFFSTAFVGLAATEYAIIRGWINSQQAQQDLKQEKLESELKFLKTQLNPHFLFNTLNSLYALTLKKSDLAPEIVMKLSEAMRYMLYECNVDIVPLEKEITYIDNYLELERIRHADSVDIKFELEGLVTNQMIAPLLFIPFIENSFKHGLGGSVGMKYVHIKMYVKNNLIKMSVENNIGKKIAQVQGKKSGGIGLTNIKTRLRLLYPDQYKLDIIDNNQVYKVVLEIKLNEITNQ